MIDCIRELTPHFEANNPLVEMMKKLEPVFVGKSDYKTHEDELKQKTAQNQSENVPLNPSFAPPLN